MSTHEAPQAGDLEAARLLLARLGVNPADLLTDTTGSTERPVPTVGEWIPVVTGLVSPSTAENM
ncbi:hypothetical protein [Saccharomonospora iraqiensis]|uniref:hypothetical protein n=1 Tax=Saccharomonospora iraqiensis TaxID=52698 RepID=UPI00022E321B|nr:hypothetical protein [Saccharomonospora iraqiensis]